jgi:membrane fusion protein, multidrug efflux system
MVRSRRELLAGALAAGVAIAAAWGLGCGDADPPEAGRPPVAVGVAPAVRKTVPTAYRAPATVQPIATVAIRSRIDSVVTAVHFREGDDVEAGQLLFTLDDRSLQDELRQLLATVEADQAELTNARDQYDRARELESGGVASPASLDQAKAAYESARAKVDVTRAAISGTRVQIGYTHITAPISGRTGVVAVTPGNNVEANGDPPLTVIEQIAPIRVEFGLPQSLLEPLRARLAAGTVQVALERDGARLHETGTLTFVDNRIDPATGSFLVHAEFANDDHSLWPGRSVVAEIDVGGSPNALTVPGPAVQRGPEGDFVFVIAGGVAHVRPVSVERYEGGLAVVSSGLEEGELVAIDGLVALRDDSPVRIAEGPGEEAAP